MNPRVVWEKCTVPRGKCDNRTGRAPDVFQNRKISQTEYFSSSKGIKYLQEKSGATPIRTNRTNTTSNKDVALDDN